MISALNIASRFTALKAEFEAKLLQLNQVIAENLAKVLV